MLVAKRVDMDTEGEGRRGANACGGEGGHMRGRGGGGKCLCRRG